jgi:hypothetical protein
LSRLPGKYRAVIVLCDLEGKTRAEAARELGCPEGTVAGRLARARALLAKRLARHGLPASGAALAGVLSQSAPSAGVPTSVVSSTVNAASLYAAGQAAAAGVISAEVGALVEAVLKTLLLTKLKLATALLVVVTSFVGAGVVRQCLQAADQAPAAKQAEQADKSGSHEGKWRGPCARLAAEEVGEEIPKEAVQAESWAFAGQARSALVFGKDSDATSAPDPMKKPDRIDPATTAAQVQKDPKAIRNKALPPGLAKKAADHPGRAAWLKAHGG